MISPDVVLISPALFATMQFGRNHIAAKAVKDGVTPMGYPYRPPPGEHPEQDPFRLEAMERALHARLQFTTLSALRREEIMDLFHSQEEFNVAFGNAAQGALEHTLRALMASWGKEYARIHDLIRLEADAREAIPEFQGLQSPVDMLSRFAGGEIYGTPDLEHDIEELFALVQADLAAIFDRVRLRSQFNPWTVRKSDFDF